MSFADSISAQEWLSSTSAQTGALGSNGPAKADAVADIISHEAGRAPEETAAPAAGADEGLHLAAPSLGTLQRMVKARMAALQPLSADDECMAKVVYHEAANQDLRGQLAVAQVVLNRLRVATFPKSVCGVINQPGQFFATAAYAPPTHSHRWMNAVAVALVAQERKLAQVAPGALFYHAAYVQPNWRRDRIRVAQIGDQIFYR